MAEIQTAEMARIGFIFKAGIDCIGAIFERLFESREIACRTNKFHHRILVNSRAGYQLVLTGN